MTDAVTVRCPHCSKVIDVPRGSIGRVVSCPECRKEMKLPADLPGAGSPPTGPPSPQPPPEAGPPQMACAGCGQAIMVEPQWAGATRACPNCGRSFVMPGGDAQSAPVRPGGAGGWPYAPSGGDVAESTIQPLRNTKGWVAFIGVLLCIFTAMAFLGVLGMGIVMARFPSEMASLICFMMLFYVAIALFYLVLGVQLLKYGSSIGQLERSKRVVDLDRALSAQKVFWKLAGILTIIGLALAVLWVIFLVATGGGGHHHVYDPTNHQWDGRR